MMLNRSGMFRSYYRCYSVALCSVERDNLEQGGKIILPPSALDTLSRMNIVYPMLFRIESGEKFTHCGVNEFIAEEGRVHVPYWIMKNLGVNEGAILRVTNVSLPVATFSLFKPHNEDFFKITDPKSVLEKALSNYSCLTAGDVITIGHEGENHILEVKETKPENAVCIVECDMSVDFQMPPKTNGTTASGEAEPAPATSYYSLDGIPLPSSGFQPFSGKGKKLIEKRSRENFEADLYDEQETKIATKFSTQELKSIPDYNYQIGTLHFFRGQVNHGSNGVETISEPEANFQPFQGLGQSLFKRKKS